MWLWHTDFNIWGEKIFTVRYQKNPVTFTLKMVGSDWSRGQDLSLIMTSNDLTCQNCHILEFILSKTISPRLPRVVSIRERASSFSHPCFTLFKSQKSNKPLWLTSLDSKIFYGLWYERVSTYCYTPNVHLSCISRQKKQAINILPYFTENLLDRWPNYP